MSSCGSDLVSVDTVSSSVNVTDYRDRASKDDALIFSLMTSVHVLKRR